MTGSETDERADLIKAIVAEMYRRSIPVLVNPNTGSYQFGMSGIRWESSACETRKMRKVLVAVKDLPNKIKTYMLQDVFNKDTFWDHILDDDG